MRHSLTLTCLLTASACLWITGCVGGIHHQGQHQFTMTGNVAHPIKGHAGWPSGNGRADNVGLTLGYSHFLKDRLAFLVAATPYKLYNQSDGDVYAGELQIGFRYFFYEFDLGKTPVALHADICGGMLHAAKSVPEQGSNTNFTADIGLGMEIQLQDDLFWIVGYHIKHLSNGDFFNDDNPGQNEHFAYTGLAFTLN